MPSLPSLPLPALPLGLDRDLARMRDRLGQGIFAMVAGPEGPQNRERIHGAPGPRWFSEDSPIRREQHRARRSGAFVDDEQFLSHFP